MEPFLAKSWKVSDDKLTYTLNLRDDVTWHDGKPFTSEDVKFTYEEMLAKIHPTLSLSFGKVLSSVETPDKYTVLVKLKNPFLPIERWIFGNKQFGTIQAKHLYEGTNILTNPYNTKPVGTGPFIFTEWVKGDHVTLVHNPNYWQKGKPYLEKVIMKFVGDSDARVRSFDTRDTDYLPNYSVPNQEYKRLMSLPDVTYDLHNEDCQGLYHFFMNMRRKYIEDINVRQAMAYALNMDQIIQQAFYGFGIPAVTTISPGLGAYHNPNVKPYPYDPDKANHILDQAGYAKGADGMRFKIEILAFVGLSAATKSAEIARENWKNVGIDTVVNIVDFGTLTVKGAAGEFDVLSHGVFSVADPSIGVRRLLDGRNITKVWVSNLSGYQNPRIDQLWDLVEKESDFEKRKNEFWEMQEILIKDLPLITTVEPNVLAVWWNDFDLNGLMCGTHNAHYEGVWWNKGKIP